jgi:hypothetical protein
MAKHIGSGINPSLLSQSHQKTHFLFCGIMLEPQGGWLSKGWPVQVEEVSCSEQNQVFKLISLP